MIQICRSHFLIQFGNSIYCNRSLLIKVSSSAIHLFSLVLYKHINIVYSLDCANNLVSELGYLVDAQVHA